MVAPTMVPMGSGKRWMESSACIATLLGRTCTARFMRVVPSLSECGHLAAGRSRQQSTNSAAKSSCLPIASASGIGTAFPICRAMAVFEPTHS